MVVTSHVMRALASPCARLPTRLSQAKGTTSVRIIRKIKYEVDAESYWDWYVISFMLRNVLRRQPLMPAHFQGQMAAEQGLLAFWLERVWMEGPYFSSHSYFRCLNLFGFVSCCSVPELFTKDFLNGLKRWEGECPRGAAPEMSIQICIFRLLSHSLLKTDALVQCCLTPSLVFSWLRAARYHLFDELRDFIVLLLLLLPLDVGVCSS